MVAYLEIQVSQNTFLLPMACIQEVLNIPAALVVPVASMPMSVLGLINHRSQVYWALDLGKVLGLSPLDNPPKYAIAIVKIDDEIMAIASEQINSIHKLPQPIGAIAPNTPTSSIPYLDGCIDTWMILNPKAILKSVLPISSIP